MKNKTPKPRVMWANYEAGIPSRLHCKKSDADAWDYAGGTHYPAPFRRVAVIPLDDVKAIVERAADAYADAYRTAPDFKWTMQYGIRAVLTAAGIPCRKASK